MESGRSRGYRIALFSVMVAALLATTACTDFSEQDAQSGGGSFTSATEAPVAPNPKTPTTDETTPPPGPCVDYDPNVIATCLASTGDLAPPDSGDGLTTTVAERTTGKVITERRFGVPRTLAQFIVDGSGDGGLIAFAKSPDYDQDQLMYALITTPSDNRVVRLAPGDVAKPILSGIPKSATGNMGAMYFKSRGELIVATGNANDPAAAADPSSLAGKILSITSLSPGDTARPRVLASGMGSNVALCPSATSGTLYVADRATTEDRLSAVSATGLKTIWTWPGKPGIAGCVVNNRQIFVTTTRGKNIQGLKEPTASNPAIDKPAVYDVSNYGSPGRIAQSPSGQVMHFATVNRTVGPGKTIDERVVTFVPPQGEQKD